jgi:protein-disulfide isomerase
MSTPEEPRDGTAAPSDGSRVRGPVYVKDPPAWSYFLSPAALILGSLIIAGAIWWTRDDSPAAPSDQFLAQQGAISTVPPSGTSAAAPTGLLDAIRGYARQVGLDEGKFNTCVSDQGNVARITQDLQTGNALGVTGTPTFFINNKKLVGAQPLALLNEIVQAELKGSPTSLDAYSAAVQALAATNPPIFTIMEKGPDITGASIEGSANAKVVIAEFSDFQCPFCKQWTDQSLRQLRTELGDDVSLAFMHFPIVQIHPNAGNASLVAVCAGQQGKFWEMHDLLFARQAEWQNLK